MVYPPHFKIQRPGSLNEITFFSKILGGNKKIMSTLNVDNV